MDVAFILPIFGQAGYMPEAVNSALAQETDLDFVLILVDDACPQPDTVKLAERYASQFPEKVLYWRSPVNRGLSAMRNEGVQKALELFPDLFAVVFLDGDDKLHPKMLQRGVTALKAAQSDTPDQDYKIGWIYEDWDYFGVDGILRPPREYQTVVALSGCQQTPGSICLAEMFRSGLSFREDMRSGAEDWHFWVSCHQAGYRGRHAENIGFRYRRRPGGLAFVSARNAAKNRSLIEQDHSGLYDPATFLEAESEESPRFAIIGNSGTVQLCGDPNVPGRQVDTDTLVDMLAQLKERPYSAAPYMLIFVSDEARSWFERNGLFQWLLWRLESLTVNEKFGFISFGEADGTDVHLRSQGIDFGEVSGPGAISLRTESFFYGMTQADSFEQIRAVLGHRIESLHGNIDAGPDMWGRLTSLCESVVDAVHENETVPKSDLIHNWAPFGTRRDKFARLLFSADDLFPDTSAEEGTLIAVYDHDLETEVGRKAVLTIAEKVFEEEGNKPSLLVMGARVDPALFEHFRATMMVPIIRSLDGNWIIDGTPMTLVGLIMPFKRLLTVGCDIVVPAFNEVRRFGRFVEAMLLYSDNGKTRLEADFINCFKVFSKVHVPNETARDRALAHGVASEQIAVDLLMD